MRTFQGTYFDGKSSKAHPVAVTFGGELLHVTNATDNSTFTVPLEQCVITPPLGKTARVIKLPHDAQIETSDLEAIAGIERRQGMNFGIRFIHALENHWKAVAGASVGLALFVWTFISLGIPLLAKHIAYSLSPEITETLSRQTLQILDSKLMKPSRLSPDRTKELDRLFDRLHGGAGRFNYRLEFRRSPHIGPNAFALPSGIIVVTDELVNLARNDKELEGVLLHEIAHVENRHGLRSLVQNAGAYVVIAALVGDIASLYSAAASLPVMLAQSGYSRDFEREADRSAALYFIERHESTEPFRQFLSRLTANAAHYPGESIFSSHPMTQERVRYIRELESSSSSKAR